MRNILKKSLLLLLCLCLTLSMAHPALAAETEEADGSVLYIRNRREFLSFAEGCRLDSYSQELSVKLLVDLDLSDTAFEGIPIFCGTFEGNGHTISGLSITCDGSALGLFRYLTATAVVRNLKAAGQIAPGGTRSDIGGIAGHNAGLIENCTFSGDITGADNVGGLAGVNEVTGVIDNCRTYGTVAGNHSVGGMTGENQGVIRTSTNRALVNTTAAENSVEISDITIDTLTNTESAATVTDIGGIAGTSSGVIRDCKNRGEVGYQHMGYNIGGIAGTQSGYIYSCENYARVYGRKEVGGIVGQMEPTTIIEFTEDTLQILQKQLNSLSSLAGQAISGAQNSAEAVTNRVGSMYQSIQDAKDAVDSLKPDLEEPSLPDWDSIEAAKNNISSSITSMKSNIGGLLEDSQDASASLNRTLRALSSQIAAMSATISRADENLGGTITDISDRDSADDLTGKVDSCSNFGAVLADINAGGIVGAIARENDLDPEDDIQISGNSSLNFNTELRSVILSCRNTASVTAKKQNAGGIVGWMVLGLARDCLNTGDVTGESADHVGGIAGKSDGYIRQSSAKCTIDGGSYVGGIAGEGATVTDCRSMVRLSGGEKSGAVLGFWSEPASVEEEEETQALLNNFYLSVDSDIGAIDGVSYSGLAQPLDQMDFYALEDIPYVFNTIDVRFLFDNGSQQVVALHPGRVLTMEEVPEIPEKEGCVSYWEGLDEETLSAITFDTTFRAVYISHTQTVQSKDTRDNGLAVLLAQGAFTESAAIVTKALTDCPVAFREGCSFTLPAGTPTGLRYLPDGAFAADRLQVMVCNADGDWRDVSFTQDESYLVFAIEEGDSAFCLVETEPDCSPIVWTAIGAAVLAAAALLLLKKKRRKK